MFYLFFSYLYLWTFSCVTYNCIVHGADLTCISLLVILCMWWIKKSWILRTRQCVTSLPFGQLVLTSWPPSSQRSSTDHWSCAKSLMLQMLIHLNTFKKNSNIKNLRLYYADDCWNMLSVLWKGSSQGTCRFFTRNLCNWEEELLIMILLGFLDKGFIWFILSIKLLQLAFLQCILAEK